MAYFHNRRKTVRRRNKKNMTMTMTMHERDIIMAIVKIRGTKAEKRKQTKLMNVGKKSLLIPLVHLALLAFVH